jgi:UDP-N-acetylmuramate--alanine ligase
MTRAQPEDDPARPWGGRRLHFIGIGGAGMSGYARAAHALGARVSGSDRSTSPFLERLRADGIVEADLGHDAGQVPPGDDVEVVYSSAVGVDNAERLSARTRGLRELSRADLLGELTALRRTIAVAGAHGKTTTASMIVAALSAAQLQPSWLVGSSVGGGRANAQWTSGEWLVVEADESDHSMLSLKVEIAVVTNVELDHHAAFGSLAQLREDFRAFLAPAPRAVIWDRPELLELRDGEAVPYDALDVLLTAGGSRFTWRGREVVLSVPGSHNAVNAAGALEAARLAGAEPGLAIAGVSDFRGSARRFQVIGRHRSGALLIDDYAHHPTEVAATLAGARTLEHARVVAVFQPHLYSRTAALAREFGNALALADVVVVLDIYPAREAAEDFPGISGLIVARAASDAGAGRAVHWAPSFESARKALDEILSVGDVVALMGAGDIDMLTGVLAADVPAKAGRA